MDLLDDMFNYGGWVNISAETPIFPLGVGWKAALINLSTFPKHFKFYEIETVGSILSFASTNKLKNQNIPADYNYHIAFDVADLIELSKKGLVEGLRSIGEIEYTFNQYQGLVKRYGLDNNGLLNCYFNNPTTGEKEQLSIKPPDLPLLLEGLSLDYHKEEIETWSKEKLHKYIQELADENEDYFSVTYSSGFNLSKKGIMELEKICEYFEIPEPIQKIINPLIKIEYLDTAIREVAIYFEHLIKSIHKTKKFGQELIDLHIFKCIQINNGEFIAGLKVYRQLLLNHNSFIRNYYIHSRQRIELNTYKSILWQQCYLYKLMQQAFIRILD